MASDQFVEVAGFGVALDRAYDPTGHFWVSMVAPGLARVGMDSLGVETSGTIAQLAFVPVGEELKRGEAFGSLEAAKFVGPLVSPLSGTVSATNDAVLADPALVEREPYTAAWLLEIQLADPAELDELVSGPEAVRTWFGTEVEDYRLKGVLAE
ncbi:MAG TPA: glycine cleavage system protein H [Acidimicrobiia bacterium]|nr:glycine cleavage system protein H [Acidimicrobiia bacterium]